MKPSAKTGVALTITALSLVVTVGAGSARTMPVDEEFGGVIGCCTYGAERFVTQLPKYPAYVDMMNQLRNLTEPNAIKWGWSQGLANDQASAGMTRDSGS